MPIADAGSGASSGPCGISHEEVAAVVRLLASVCEGDDDARLTTEGLPAAHPLRDLHEGINAVIAALAAARRRRAQTQMELEERLTTIELQRAALRDLSTPIIEVGSGVLCLPVIGVMDSERSAQMMGQLLSAVAGKAAAHVIIDVTGLTTMDERTLSHFVAMARASQLLGAACVITGIRPGVAQLMIEMGLDTRAIRTLPSLREALTRLRARPAPRGA
ncbi:MAG TPA: STAS domain-containing protein [Polyangiaceae bacterium]|nr:STAS domain-containing protein [Polyangiaceae bacterium]